MFNHLRKSDLVWAFIFLGLALIAYRRVLLTPGMVGFSWDWSVLPHPFQESYRLLPRFSAWNPKPSMGVDTIREASALYLPLFLWPLSFLGGEFLSKFLIVFLTVLAGWTAFRLLRSLNLGRIGAFAGAFFYMFSPVLYSRVVAGHGGRLFGYALIPIFLLYLFRCFKNRKFVLRDALLGGLFYALSASDFVILGSLGVLVLVFTTCSVICSLWKRLSLRPLVLYLVTIHLVFLLLNSFYIVPAAQKLLEGGGESLSGRAISQELIGRRRAFLWSSGTSLGEALTFRGEGIMATEFVYPLPRSLRWIFSPLLAMVVLSLFGVAFCPRKEMLFEKVFFSVLAVSGGILGAGSNTAVGKLFYEDILVQFEPLFYAFSRPSRFNLLLPVSYLGLLGISFDVLDRLRAKKGFRSLGTGLIFLGGAALFAFAYPFWSGDITKPQAVSPQPLSLVVKRLEETDRKLFSTFKNLPGDFRISFLPPAELFFTPERNFSFPWTYKYQKKPEFIGGTVVLNPLQHFLVSTLFQQNLGRGGPNSTGSEGKGPGPSLSGPGPGEFGPFPSDSSPRRGGVEGPGLVWGSPVPMERSKPFGTGIENIGKLFGLANVRYLILPEQKIYAYYNFGNFPLKLGEYGYLYEPETNLDAFFSSQKNLEKKIDFGQLEEEDRISVYENKNNLPHLYAPERIFVATGDLSGLVPLSFVDDFEFEKNVLLFSSELTRGDFERLANYKAAFLNVEERWLDFLLPFIGEEFFIYPGLQSLGFRRGWFPICQGWYDFWELSGVLDKSLGVRSIGEAEGDYNFFLPEGARCEIYLEALSSEDSSEIFLGVDGAELGMVDLKSETARGFGWKKVGEVSLSSGQHTISLETGGGKNAVGRILVVPKEHLEEARRAFGARVDGNYFSLTEAETVAETRGTWEAPIRGVSRGSLVELPCSGKIFAPKGDYTISFRVQAERGASLCFDFGERRLGCEEISPGDDYQWPAFDLEVLESGRHNFAVTSKKGKASLDLIYLSPKGSGLSEGGGSVSYTRKSPTRYQLDGAQGPLLVFSESYDPEWELVLESGEKVKPWRAWGSQNLYLLDPGDESRTLIYAPQKLKTLSLITSLVSWAGVLVWALRNLASLR